MNNICPLLTPDDNTNLRSGGEKKNIHFHPHIANFGCFGDKRNNGVLFSQEVHVRTGPPFRDEEEDEMSCERGGGCNRGRAENLSAGECIIISGLLGISLVPRINV